MISTTNDTCPRCAGRLFPNVDRDPSCLRCGYVSVVVPEFVLAEVAADAGQSQRRGRKPTHGGMTI